MVGRQKVRERGREFGTVTTENDCVYDPRVVACFICKVFIKSPTAPRTDNSLCRTLLGGRPFRKTSR